MHLLVKRYGTIRVEEFDADITQKIAEVTRKIQTIRAATKWLLVLFVFHRYTLQHIHKILDLRQRSLTLFPLTINH